MPYYDALDLPWNDMICNDAEERNAKRQYNAVFHKHIELLELSYSGKINRFDIPVMLGEWLYEFMAYEYDRYIHEGFTHTSEPWGEPEGSDQESFRSYIISKEKEYGGRGLEVVGISSIGRSDRNYS